jgi:hypothetical protein
MWYRRGVFYAMLGAVVVLPVWLLVSRGLIFTDTGWDFLGYFLLAPMLAVTLGVVAGLVWARKSVRSSRAVSNLDAALLSAWYLTIALYGAAGDEGVATAIAVVGVLLAVACFWAAGWQLVHETRSRLKNIVTTFEQQAVPRSGQQPGPGEPGPGTGSGPVIRIDPPSDRRP